MCAHIRTPPFEGKGGRSNNHEIISVWGQLHGRLPKVAAGVVLKVMLDVFTLLVLPKITFNIVWGEFA